MATLAFGGNVVSDVLAAQAEARRRAEVQGHLDAVMRAAAVRSGKPIKENSNAKRAHLRALRAQANLSLQREEQLSGSVDGVKVRIAQVIAEAKHRAETGDIEARRDHRGIELRLDSAMPTAEPWHGTAGPWESADYFGSSWLPDEASWKDPSHGWSGQEAAVESRSLAWSQDNVDFPMPGAWNVAESYGPMSHEGHGLHSWDHAAAEMSGWSQEKAWQHTTVPPKPSDPIQALCAAWSKEKAAAAAVPSPLATLPEPGPGFGAAIERMVPETSRPLREELDRRTSCPRGAWTETTASTRSAASAADSVSDGPIAGEAEDDADELLASCWRAVQMRTTP